MDSIKELLKNKIIVKKISKPRQIRLFKQTNYYLQAKEFSDYLGLNVYFVLKCIKKYGANRVFSLRSFLKDYPVKRGKSINGLVIWKLKKL